MLEKTVTVKDYDENEVKVFDTLTKPRNDLTCKSTHREMSITFCVVSAQENLLKLILFKPGGGKVGFPPLYSKIGWLEDVRP